MFSSISWSSDMLINWLIDGNFVYRRNPATLLIPGVDFLTSPESKCNIHVYDTALYYIYPRNIILTSLVFVHAGYLFCNWHHLNTNYYRTTVCGMPGSFNSSHINACVVVIGVLGPRYIVTFEGLRLYKLLPPRGFELNTSRMPGKHRTSPPPTLFEKKKISFSFVLTLLCNFKLLTSDVRQL